MENSLKEKEQIILESIRIGFFNTFSKRILDQMNLEIAKDFFTKRFTAIFTTQILGQKNLQKYSITIEVPLNWWQHFKKDKLPNWYKRFYPVIYKEVGRTVEFNHVALMPDLKVDPSEDRIIMYTEHPKEDGIYKINDEKENNE